MSETTEIARIEQPPPSNALVDLRSSMMHVPADVMKAGLAEYKERRVTFREWLRSQLVEGVHFGYPPGLAPRFNENGDMVVSVWKKGRNGQDGRYETQVVPPTSWTAKPSFYKAGADFVCDLMGLIDTYDADMLAWQQLGSPQGTFVFRCRLFPKGASQSAETLVGEGRGIRKVGTKGGDENNAIKMAKKSAKVDAVLNAYGLADLFTQDIEDAPPPGPEQFPNPEHRTDAPKAQPRGKRVSKEEVVAFYGEWQTYRRKAKLPLTDAHYAEWVEAQTGMQREAVFQVAEWTPSDIEKCRIGLKMEQGEADA